MVLASAASATSTDAGAWWGDVATPDINQLWAHVDGITPDATVSGIINLRLTCSTPQPTTLALRGIVVQVDGANVVTIYNAAAQALEGTPRVYSVDTRKFSDGWHELRARCYSMETKAGPDHGHLTQVTNGHQVNFKNGRPFVNNMAVREGMVDSHAWYDNDSKTGQFIGYVYAQIFNVHQLINGTLSGLVPITARVMTAGGAVVDHWAIKVDGNTLVEFHGSDQVHPYTLDTRKLTNGQHTFAFHGHGLAKSGKQLAGEVHVIITVRN
jgi:hypothetical protein